METWKLTDEQCRIALSFLMGALEVLDDKNVQLAIKRAEEYAINLTKGRK